MELNSTREKILSYSTWKKEPKNKTDLNYTLTIKYPKLYPWIDTNRFGVKTIWPHSSRPDRQQLQQEINSGCSSEHLNMYWCLLKSSRNR